ncbi:hypothetical protein [Xylocopilactobacillus apicola]|uniref:Zinc ribbon domain-containing protein n=1 Tax=Xylocopilactobacillus apicola TaxID=2932184 RepID=A0AAU9D732_9LACO|nr:hypothetical protein [Xylocopilactobacillus apicola]BDR58115.1 hypothetical protein XA3_05560 [Xylocopilactobacillus apicola]
MENNKNLKKQCPICGALIDEYLDYCPECDSYVGDVLPVNDDGVQMKSSEPKESNVSASEFDQLDTILDESKNSNSKITIEELQQLLAGNVQQGSRSEAVEENLPNQSLPKRGHKNNNEDAGLPPKRTELRKRRRKPTFSKEDEVEAELTNFNQPEKIVIDTQPISSTEIIDSHEFEEQESKLKNRPEKSNDNFFKELLFFDLESLVHPSVKTEANKIWQGLITFGVEIIFFIFTFQLLYNSGVQMSSKKGARAFGQYLVHSLTIGTKYSILWPVLIILGVYLVTLGLGLLCDRFLISDDEFSLSLLVAQVARYSIILLPISFLTFAYSLFNNQLVTKLTLFLLCMVPLILSIAVAIYLIQARGQVIIDRVYIIIIYFVLSIFGSYLLVHPYLISFIQAFNRFLIQ